MADEPAGPRLRPLSLGEILDVAIKICIGNWATLLKAVAIVVVPVQILTAAVTAGTVGADSALFDFSAKSTDEAVAKELNAFIGGLAITVVLGVLASLLATAACFRALAQAYLGQPTDWRSSLSFALRKTPSLLWVTAIFAVAVTLGTILLIVPGIWLYVALSFALPALLVEDARGLQAIRRSFGLVRGRWWRTCGILLVGTVLAFVVSSIAQTVFLVPIFFSVDNGVLVLVMSAIAGSVGALISTPFTAAILAVLYFDLRVRKEGFDLELLAAQIGAPAPVPAPAAAPAPGLQGDPPDGPLWPSPSPQPWEPPGRDDEPPRMPGIPSG